MRGNKDWLTRGNIIARDLGGLGVTPPQWSHRLSETHEILSSVGGDLCPARERLAFGNGWVIFASAILSCARSMLDCEPSDIEGPSEDERGGGGCLHLNLKWYWNEIWLAECE
jgi:hypothetical protein